MLTATRGLDPGLESAAALCHHHLVTIAQLDPETQALNASSWDVLEGDAWDLAPQLPPASIDAIVTSPPYWGLRSYGLQHDPSVLGRWAATGAEANVAPPYHWYRDEGGVLGLEPYPAWFVSHLVELFSALEPALVAGGSLWVNLGDTYFARWASIRDEGRQGLGSAARQRRVTPSGGVLHDKQLLMIPARFAIAMQDAGWILRNDVIWQKPHVAPRPEKDRLRLSHEHVFHFVKRSRSGRPTYFYDLTEAEPGGMDVVSVAPSRSDLKHSATFPIELIRPRIRSTTPLGGTVLDPFCGTGTTLLAASLEGRKGLGFELSPTFRATAQDRLRSALPDALEGGGLT